MKNASSTVAIPNEPYTPYIETITLSYTAKSETKLGAGLYKENPVQLWHEHPFGQTEEHKYLKNQLSFLTDSQKPIRLIPTYCKGGELYIGLENAKNRQNVSLLIQVLEGSENPEAESFVGKQKIECWILCRNEWKLLETTDIIGNETDNFLKSGIFKFTIPTEATSDNTLLPQKYFWLKAKLHKNFDAVCKVLGIHAQAVKAEFSDDGNDLSHLVNGLEADTISKLVKRIPGIKGVSQPYSSFDGLSQESDAAYYRRISERLRHKNRAITIWDYEHLVLQNFPDIHKVKCLSHTSSVVSGTTRKTSYLAPGNVVLVVIPDIINKNVFDIYKPRVSKAKLNEVKNLIQKLTSQFVNLNVINPEYEEVKVT
jgi:hypothetical protein